MFVIPCKYCKENDYITTLVDDIRKYHSDEEILIVDSASEDKSYFKTLEKYNVIIADVNNKNWMIGAFWYAYHNYNREFYYFLHDTMRVKANLDYLKYKPLTILATFDINAGPFNGWKDRVINETGYKRYTIRNRGVYGPIFFCNRFIMDNLKKNGVDKLMPTNKMETWYLERAYGAIFENEGFDMDQCSLYGDILQLESPGGKSGPFPHNTSWQYPIEKFYSQNKQKRE